MTTKTVSTRTTSNELLYGTVLIFFLSHLVTFKLPFSILDPFICV
jgi:hypothetical protein